MPSKLSSHKRLKAWLDNNMGNRFALLLKSPAKESRDDALQNAMLLLNGCLAVVFAYEWNGDNNPLLVIHNKFSSNMTFSVAEIFDSSRVAEFASLLNTLTLLVNAANAVTAFLIVMAWCVTVTGSR